MCKYNKVVNFFGKQWVVFIGILISIIVLKTITWAVEFDAIAIDNQTCRIVRWALISSMLSLLFAIFVKYLIVRKCCPCRKYMAAHKLSGVEVIASLLSVDYLTSKYHKCSFRDKKFAKDFKTKYIIYNNQINFIESFLLSLVAIIVCATTKSLIAWTIFFAIIFPRAISRSMEISISFLKDVSDSSKGTYINYTTRIRLAIVSIVEEMILFSTVVLLSGFSGSQDIDLVVDVIPLWSLAIDGLKCCVAYKVALEIYIAISMFIMVSLSLASYISDKNQKCNILMEKESRESICVLNECYNELSDIYLLNGNIEYQLAKHKDKDVILIRKVHYVGNVLDLEKVRRQIISEKGNDMKNIGSKSINSPKMLLLNGSLTYAYRLKDVIFSNNIGAEWCCVLNNNGIELFENCDKEWAEYFNKNIAKMGRIEIKE